MPRSSGSTAISRPAPTWALSRHRRAPRSWRKSARRVTPAVANIFEGGKTPVLPAAELERMGFRLGIYPSQTQRAAIFAIKETLAVLKRDGDTNAIENRLATFADREEAVDAKRWRGIEEKYLKKSSSSPRMPRKRAQFFLWMPASRG